MAGERDPSDIVPLMLRIREDLRQELEESAKARRVSLNQECIDRCQYVRDRQGLLAEVIELAYGPRLAGILMLLGLAMEEAGRLHSEHNRTPRGDRERASRDGWLDRVADYDIALRTAVALLVALRPTNRQPGEQKKPALRSLGLAARQVEELAQALYRAADPRKRKEPPSRLVPTRNTAVIGSLLGILTKRITARLEEAKQIVRRDHTVSRSKPLVTAEAQLDNGDDLGLTGLTDEE